MEAEAEEKDYSSYGFNPKDLTPAFDLTDFDLFKSTNDYLVSLAVPECQTEITIEPYVSMAAPAPVSEIKISTYEEVVASSVDSAAAEPNNLPVSFNVNALDLDSLFAQAAPRIGMPPGAMEGQKLLNSGGAAVQVPSSVLQQMAQTMKTAENDFASSAPVLKSNVELGVLKPGRLQGVQLNTGLPEAPLSMVTPRGGLLNGGFTPGAGLFNLPTLGGEALAAPLAVEEKAEEAEDAQEEE